MGSKRTSIELAKLFECKPGNSKYTKKYCNEHSGDYEVFTGSTLQKFATLDHYDYDTPNLTFTTDGEYAGSLKILTGKYNIGAHRKLLIPKSNDLDINYFEIILQPLFYENVKKGDVPSVNWNKKLSKLKVHVPRKNNGSYDLKKQKEIAKKYNAILDKKKCLLNKIDILNKIKFELDSKINEYPLFDFNKMFKLERGNVISKSDVNKNKGNYPVYSTQKETFGYINSFMKKGNYLLWNTDGLAGYIKKVNGEFSYTNIVGIMIPTGHYNMSLINLDYLKYYLEPIFRENRKGRFGINGKNEYTKLNQTMIKKIEIKIPIPTSKNGEFDLQKQKEIAQKIATLEKIKEDLIAKLIELVNISIKL